MQESKTTEVENGTRTPPIALAMENTSTDDPVARARERARKRMAERRMASTTTATNNETTTSTATDTSQVQNEREKKKQEIVDQGDLSEGEIALNEAREWLLKNPNEDGRKRTPKKKKTTEQQKKDEQQPSTSPKEEREGDKEKEEEKKKQEISLQSGTTITISEKEKQEIEDQLKMWLHCVDISAAGEASDENAAARDAGLYVGNRPKLSAFNSAAWRDRLISRNLTIIHQQNQSEAESAEKKKQQKFWNVSEQCTTQRQWLEQDGSLPTIPDVLKPLHERPENVANGEDFDRQLYQYMPASVVMPSVISSNSGTGKTFQLEVTIQGIAFRDHPLFSEEDFLATQLGILVNTYRMRQDANLPAFCAERFRVIASENADGIIQIALSPQKREQVSNLLSIWKEEEQVDRHLLKRIATLWKRISAIREEQRFSGTTARLSLKLLPRNEQMEEALLDRDTTCELITRVKDLEKVTQKQKEGEATLINQLELPKVKAIQEQIRRELMNGKYTESVKRYRAKLINEVPAEESSFPPGEQERRQRIAHSFFFIELIINGHRAARTASKQLCQMPLGDESSVFSIIFSEIFPIRLSKWPDSLILSICTVDAGKEERVADISVPIPVLETGSIPRPRPFSSSSIKWRPVWEKSEATEQSEHSLNGTLLCCSQWSRSSENGSLLSPPIPLKAKQQAIVQFQSIDQEELETSARLKEWLSSADPNDPTRSARGDRLLGKSHHFSFFDPLRLTGVNENIRRHKLLRMRRDGTYNGIAPLLEEEITDDMLIDPEQASSTAVKQSIEEDAAEIELAKQTRRITADYLDLLTQLKRPKMAEVITTNPTFLNFSFFSSLSLPKPARPLKPERVGKPSTPLLQLASPVKVLVQILHATGMPSRREHLSSKTQSKQSPTSKQETEKQQFGSTFPQQTNSTSSSATSSTQVAANCSAPIEGETDQIEPTNASEVAPFIQICLGEKSAIQQKPVRTRISTGNKPTWNESLSLTLSEAPQAGVIIEKMTGEQPFDFVFGIGDKEAQLHISLFDDVDESSNGAATTKSHFVAEFSVNLRSLLWYSSRFEGALHLHDPAFSTSHFRNSQQSQDVELALYITLDPPLSTPPSCSEFPTRHMIHLFEDKAVGEYCLEWCSALQKMGEELRRFSEPYCLTLKRKALLLTQTIKDIEPPPGLATWRQLVRYVSLIPKRKEPMCFALRRLLIAATPQEILTMHKAGVIDRAALLCSFLHANSEISRVLVLVGIAQSEGVCAYVLITDKSHGEQLVISPETGDWFPLKAPPPHCNLLDVDIAFDTENVWANLQPKLTPIKSLNLDLANTKCWKPFFCTRFPFRELPPLQNPTALTFEPTDTKFVKAVQRDVEKRVMDSIEQWRRPRLATHWNRVCSRSLGEILIGCEDAITDLGPGHSLAERVAGHDELISKWRSSFPNMEALAFSFAYGGSNGGNNCVDEMLEKLNRTQLHVTTERKAEFSLAVHIAPYPSKILSIWIYFAVLH